MLDEISVPKNTARKTCCANCGNKNPGQPSKQNGLSVNTTRVFFIRKACQIANYFKALTLLKPNLRLVF